MCFLSLPCVRLKWWMSKRRVACKSICRLLFVRYGQFTQQTNRAIHDFYATLFAQLSSFQFLMRMRSMIRRPALTLFPNGVSIAQLKRRNTIKNATVWKRMVFFVTFSPHNGIYPTHFSNLSPPPLDGSGGDSFLITFLVFIAYNYSELPKTNELPKTSFLCW